MICIISPGLQEVPTYRGGGREKQHYNISLYLSKYFRIIIISPFYGYYEKKTLINNNLRIERVYFPSCKIYPPVSSLVRSILGVLSLYFYSILASFKVIKLAKDVKIVIVTDILTGVLPAVVAKMLGIKIIYSEGNLTPWVNPYLFSRELSLIQKIFSSFEKISGKFITELSHTIRVQSSIIKEGMEKNGVNIGKVVIIGSGIDTSMFKPSYEVNYHEFKIGFIGRLSDEKGAPLLLKICEKLQKILPNVRFKILGDGQYRQYFQHLKNIEHIGWIDSYNVPIFLSDVPILLFLQRGLGAGEVEALSMGKIIIAPNVGVIPQIIKNGENGFLTAPNAESFVKTIEEVISLDQQTLEIISKNARKTALELFSLEKAAFEWKTLCSRLLIN